MKSWSPCWMSTGVLKFLSCVSIQSGKTNPNWRAEIKRAFKPFMPIGFAGPNVCPWLGTRKSRWSRDLTGVIGHKGNKGTRNHLKKCCTTLGGFTSSETNNMGATSTTPWKKAGRCTHMQAARPPPSETPPKKTFRGLPLPVSCARGRKSSTISQTSSTHANHSGTWVSKPSVRPWPGKSGSRTVKPWRAKTQASSKYRSLCDV
mmetsp:Transcript_76946/g.238324  ORF Transcript_76946/g.238324 Transcript_76946/m.238324 type:complete len:204 (-) Transcript_76946:383-994(-)